MRHMWTVLCGIWLAASGAWAGDADHDSRPLNTAERATFLRAVCSNVIGQDQKMAVCDHLIDWPGDQPTNGRSGIFLSDIAYGDFLGTGKPQAYVTYEGDFEPHATNYGGGILLLRDGASWRVVTWYSGGQMDTCVALPPARTQRMLCLSGYSGSGEFDSSVWLRTLPELEAKQGNAKAVLAAQDDRESGFDDNIGNYQCTLPRKPGEAILLSIEKLRRSHAPGMLAEADIVYAKARDVTRACRKKRFTKVRESKAVVRFKLVGDKVVPVVPASFAKTDY